MLRDVPDAELRRRRLVAELGLGDRIECLGEVYRAGAQDKGLTVDADDVTYFLGRETILVTHRKGMAIWREKLFVLMTRNAVRATAFFRLPPERVVELGVQVEI